MGESEEFLLKWHDHHNSFFQLVEELVAREQLCDVTLSCGDVILNAHSLMLSVCSPYFRMLLSESQHREKHHIIHLNGVSGKLMQQLLVYMYRGEISIAQEDLGPLIETARCLQIKGLSLASSDIHDSQIARKRPASQPQPDICKAAKERKLVRKMSPVKVPGQEICNNEAQSNQLIIEEDDECNDSFDRSQQCPAIMDESGREIKPSNQQIMLPMLPKPLSILKTAETRTYLSKLIWLGNGGKRPQYGNPETKPMWWPQHVLPWEEMKKMGGRKSQELSHINYTEILKQCLAAGYEYFGYDPATYFCMDTSLSSVGQGDDETNGKVNGDDLGDSFSLDRSDLSSRSDNPCHPQQQQQQQLDSSETCSNNTSLEVTSPPGGGGLQHTGLQTPLLPGLTAGLLPGALSRLPGDLARLPGDLSRIPGLPAIPGLTPAAALAQSSGGTVTLTQNTALQNTLQNNSDSQDPSIACQ